MRQSAGISIIIAAVLVAATALSMTGCITIQPGTIQPGGTGPGAQQTTSQRITTSESGTVVDPSGAQLAVPHGAVPENSAGGEGEMLFAIEAGSVADFHLSGAPAYARVYEMGPSGFTFAHPVRITLPLPHGFNREKDLAIVCRYNRASEKWDVVGGRVNDTGDAISVDVKHLSIFMPVIGGSIANLPTIGGSIIDAPTIGGSIIDAPIIGGDIAFAPVIGGSIANVNILQPGGSMDSARGQVQFKCSLDHRFNVRISQVVNMKHYDGVPAWMQKEVTGSGWQVGERFCPTCCLLPNDVVDVGYIGVHLPQGTYNFCVEQYGPFCGCPPATCELEGHYFLNNVTIGEPCIYPWYRTRTLDSSSNPQFGTSSDLLPGRCPGYGAVTPTPGGEQQLPYPMADGDVYAYSYRNWNWANWGGYGTMGAGWNPTGGEKRTYLRFDLPAGPGSSRAVLKLYQYHIAGSAHTLGVYRVTSPWNEGTGVYHSGEVEQTAAPGELCWMQQPSFDPVPVATFSSASAVPAWVEMDITSLVHQWQAGTPNYGLVIKTTNEHPTARDPEAVSGFRTKEDPDQANWPVLELYE